MHANQKNTGREENSLKVTDFVSMVNLFFRKAKE
jgi:hypothetical protein